MVNPVLFNLKYGALSQRGASFFLFWKGDSRGFTLPLYFHWNFWGLPHSGSDVSERSPPVNHAIDFMGNRVIPLACRGCDFADEECFSSFLQRIVVLLLTRLLEWWRRDQRSGKINYPIPFFNVGSGIPFFHWVSPIWPWFIIRFLIMRSDNMLDEITIPIPVLQ